MLGIAMMVNPASAVFVERLILVVLVVSVLLLLVMVVLLMLVLLVVLHLHLAHGERRVKDSCNMDPCYGGASVLDVQRLGSQGGHLRLRRRRVPGLE